MEPWGWSSPGLLRSRRPQTYCDCRYVGAKILKVRWRCQFVFSDSNLTETRKGMGQGCVNGRMGIVLSVKIIPTALWQLECSLHSEEEEKKIVGKHNFEWNVVCLAYKWLWGQWHAYIDLTLFLSFLPFLSSSIGWGGASQGVWCTHPNYQDSRRSTHDLTKIKLGKKNGFCIRRRSKMTSL